MSFTDTATLMRTGEELDASKIEAFLKDCIPGLDGSITVRQFPSGHSNLTYLLAVGNRELVLRRPPFGTKAATAHDMGREYRILNALHSTFPYCPTPLAYTDDPSVMGSPFYVMERLRGIVLRKDLPPGLAFSPEQARELSENFLRVLVELHSIDYKSVGLESFGKPQGYVKRQVEGWVKRYRAARTPDAPEQEDIMEWLLEKMPPDSDRPGIVHNDYRLDNVVLDEQDPTKIVGVLDWEMATIGDPLLDFGNSLCYWIRHDDPEELHVARLVPTNMKGVPTREEVVRFYEQNSGRSIANCDFYSCFGLFRLGAIFQQIYYRYYHGETQDERFKSLIGGVKALEWATRRVVERSEL
ncbi:MAG: phosphotransferase family protein [Deltaproteobacteria bacterium]|nr:phosphotransferase family protein [Deltaproteobacteria bacterium]